MIAVARRDAKEDAGCSAVHGNGSGVDEVEGAVEAAEHREGQDHLAVLGLPVIAPQKIRDGPDEGGKIGVGHGGKAWSTGSSGRAIPFGEGGRLEGRGKFTGIEAVPLRFGFRTGSPAEDPHSPVTPVTPSPSPPGNSKPPTTRPRAAGKLGGGRSRRWTPGEAVTAVTPSRLDRAGRPTCGRPSVWGPNHRAVPEHGRLGNGCRRGRP